jgi:hypothetical protein
MFELQSKLVRAWSKQFGIGPILAPLPGTAAQKRR